MKIQDKGVVTPREVIDKLYPTLLQEGLEVDFLSQEGSLVNIRARRVGAGVPVAFLVKAIAGTYRRYLPDVKDVCLAEYDPGVDIPIAPSETFEVVFKHSAAVHALLLGGLPVVDLAGLGRRDAIQAIEGCVSVWGGRSPIVAIQGLTEDAPLAAAKKWSAVYRDGYKEIKKLSPGRWEITFGDGNAQQIADLKAKGDEIMPGRIFLTNFPPVNGEEAKK
jgi:hypothetical protein